MVKKVITNHDFSKVSGFDCIPAVVLKNCLPELSYMPAELFNMSLKVLSATFLLVCFLDLNKSTCQTREKVFYFTSKTLFVLEKIKF